MAVQWGMESDFRKYNPLVFEEKSPGTRGPKDLVRTE